MSISARTRRRPRLTVGILLTSLVAVVSGVALTTGELRFLDQPTGWQLGFSVVPQQPSDPYWQTIGISVLNTIVMAGLGIAIATLLGGSAAFIVMGGNPAWSRFAKGYVQIFRNMPLILQALFWFAVLTHLPGPRQAIGFAGIVASNRGVSLPFVTPAGLAILGAALATFMVALIALRGTKKARQRWPLAGAIALGTAGIVHFLGFTGEPLFTIPHLVGFNFRGGLHVPTEFLAVMIALSMFGSAYVAEIVRGGFATVPEGVVDAARALGLPAWVVELKVRAPLALRAIILPLGSQYTTLIKATSIGLAVGFTDLFAVTLMSINQSGHTIALLCVMTACFVVLNQLAVSAANALNQAFEIPGHGQH
jgi:general L-amino acid transport system permease protein